MISENIKGRILAQLQNRVDTLTSEWRQGSTNYHFCHPMQKTYRDEKEKEINDCKELIKVLEESEFE